jgi:molecular chaperone DnaK
VKNQAEALIHASEKTLKDSADKIPPDAKQAIEAAIADLKGVLESGDLGQIRAKTETLAQASMKAGEALYKAQTPPPGGDAGPNSQGGGDQGGAGSQGPNSQDGGSEKVVDADFEEVDEKKKRGSV